MKAKKISIRTPLPGPRARKILQRDHHSISPSYTRVYPLVIAQAQGMMVQDVDGNVFLDFTAGVATCQTGHAHPEVVQAIQRQAGQFLHMCGTDFYYSHMPDLAEELARLAPGAGRKKTFFTNSGTETIEAAMKLTRYYTRRPRWMAFVGAFHGRTFGSLSLTAAKAAQRRHFAPLLPEVTHVPYPYCYRCPYNLKFPQCNFHCVSVIEEVYFKKVAPPEDIAAVVVEPIQGEGGYVVPPPGYFEKLSALLKKYEILLVADEIQSGMGRTGKMFAIEHWDVVPDVLTLAKGIASGLPLGAMVADQKYFTWGPGAHATTFGGNPVSCAAALKTLQLLKRGLVQNAERLGRFFLETLQTWPGRFPFLGDVRGKGLMIGLEIVKDPQTKAIHPELRNTIVQRAFERGLLILPCGDNTIRLCPPLVISEKEATLGMEILEKIFTDVSQRKRTRLS